jgi:hypothetical protein
MIKKKKLSATKTRRELPDYGSTLEILEISPLAPEGRKRAGDKGLPSIPCIQHCSGGKQNK